MKDEMALTRIQSDREKRENVDVGRGAAKGYAAASRSDKSDRSDRFADNR